MTARCDITDLPVTDCAHCRKLPDPGREGTEYGPWTLAQYDGTCATCWCPFEAGSQIRADGSGGWEADCCGGGP